MRFLLCRCVRNLHEKKNGIVRKLRLEYTQVPASPMDELLRKVSELLEAVNMGKDSL